MSLNNYPVLGTFAIPQATASGNTAFAALIPPFGGLQALNKQSPPTAKGIAHLSKLCYTTGATAHKLTIMRPFNWTTASADGAYGQAVLNFTADPGLYATAANWKRPPFPNGATPSIGNNAMAGGDYVVYQNADGTWTLDTISSVATLAVTMTGNLGNASSATGTAVKQGAPIYWYGVVGDSDPSTGYLNPQHTIALSQTSDVTYTEAFAGVVQALYPGDPMIIYSANTTNAGTLEYACGFYADR